MIAIYTRAACDGNIPSEDAAMIEQTRRCLDTIERDGMVSVPLDVYKDHGHVGTLRAAYRSMMQDVDAGAITDIYCTSMDRLHRDLVEWTKMVKRLRKANCQLHILDGAGQEWSAIEAQRKGEDR